jgi:hypothetical protein
VPSSPEEVQQLVDYPRESLAVELRAWFDPDTLEGQAKIIKGCTCSFPSAATVPVRVECCGPRTSSCWLVIRSERGKSVVRGLPLVAIDE